MYEHIVYNYIYLYMKNYLLGNTQVTLNMLHDNKLPNKMCVKKL